VSGFVDVCDAEEVVEGEVLSFPLDSVRLCLTRADGVLAAFDEDCTHRRCSLIDAEIDGTVLICPYHGAEFDLRTGAVLIGPATKPLPLYETRVVDGRVEVRLP
jgi:3-phenylpropionate/trans-cinnamate dioxygenase ferredoxin subunit/anthranilate 1,2-dioxygenase ferredoxin subunit